jgi:hypothetical protein
MDRQAAAASTQQGEHYCSFQLSWRGAFSVIFFDPALYFLCSPCSTFSTTTTQRIRSIFTALESCYRGLSINVEFFPKF